MATLRAIREKHLISRKTLAELSGVSESTLVRIENSAHKITEDVAKDVLAALNKKTGESFTLEDIEGFNLYNVMRDRRQRSKDDGSSGGLGKEQ